MIVILVCLFLVWRVYDVFFSALAPFFIPYLGFFSYGNTMGRYNLPPFLTSLSNFDGIFYIRIGLNGYQQYEQAYFPMYPTLIHFLTPMTNGNPIIAGILITNSAFLIGLLLLNKFLNLIKFPEKLWFFLFLFAYPTSFFFGVMYTESLFFLFLVSIFFFMKQKNYWLTFLFGYLVGITRVVGVLAVFYFGVILFLELIKLKKHNFDQIKKIVPLFLVTISPVLGLISYSFYLWRTFGDPLYFFHAQEHFGAHRSTSLIFLPQVLYRYVRIFLTADRSFQYFVSVVEVSFFVFAFALLLYDLIRIIQKRKALDQFRLGLNLFSFANLIVPTLTGTLTAIPRYSMLCLSIFFVLAEIKNRSVKIVIWTIFILLHIAFLSLFIQGYYLT